MTEQAVQTPSPAAPEPTARDLQRGALRELIALSAQSAATEADIEREAQAAETESEKELARGRSNVELRFKSLREEIQQKHKDRIVEIDAQFQAELDSIKAQEKAARQTADHDFDNVKGDVEQRVQQAVWLAESVFEGTQNQLREEGKKARDELVTQLEALDAMQQQAANLLRTYMHPAPEPPDVAGEDAEKPFEDADAAFRNHLSATERHLHSLKTLTIPRLFVGARPYVIVAIACIVAGVVGHWIGAGMPLDTAHMQEIAPDAKTIALSVLAAIGMCGVLGIALFFIGRAQARKQYVPLMREAAEARRAARQRTEQLAEQRETKRARAVRKRTLETQAVKDQFAPLLSRAEKNHLSMVANLTGDHDRRMSRIQGQLSKLRGEANEWLRQHAETVEQKYDREIKAVTDRHETQTREARERREQRTAELRRKWDEGLRQIQNPIVRAQTDGSAPRDWNDAAWKKWTPPKQFTSQIPFGRLGVDLKQVTDQVPKTLELPKSFAVPASIALPRQASMMIHFDRAARAGAIATIQTVMVRLLTNLPAGRVRFTLIDPVGLGQNFAGFMHLADHDEALVGGRIWTEAEHIDQRLADLTEHMETVIQKYLRNEFETIDDYNAQAGELAEPYRFLVIADLPVNFSAESFRRLGSIASTGARCGVYVLIARDLRQPLPGGAHIEDIEAHCANLVQKDDRFVWRDEVFERFPLTLDTPPSEEFLTSLMDIVGRHAREAKRVEVAFESIAPPPDKIWSSKSAMDLVVPIGRLGATRLQSLKLGRGVAQHALIAGKTGSGKSTLLHALVTNLAMWYSPDEVEFYLVDFKKGVEFKTYATNELPHARAIAVESDREFGLSVLQRVDAELSRRGEMFRQAGVQDLASFRQASEQKLPRTLLIIDEFQEFFSEDDRLSQEASTLLDRLVRQGRAFGIHVLLGSQTIGGTSGLSRSTIGQMAIRIALQTSEADSHLILGDNNSAARLLTRPGEAIYNDAGGLVEGNSPFQIAWLPDEKRDKYLASVRKLAESNGAAVKREPAIVFEGNAPADMTKNRKLRAALAMKDPVTAPPQAWLGEPVAIKDPTAVVFRRQSGANLVIVGQQEEAAMALLSSAMIALASQVPKASKFYVLDGSPADSPLAPVMPRIKQSIPQEVKLIEYRAAEEAMAELAEEMQRRQTSGGANPPPVFVIIYGLQRYRALRKQEDSFSFGASDEEKKPHPDKQFTDLLREGPALGMHVLAWCDTPAAVERTLDRTSMREFDNRVLFQMSAADSSNLIDSPMANKLGQHRALLYSEEQGMMEKFRPYAIPGAWLDRVKQALAARTG